MKEEEKKAIENMESFINYFNRIRNSDEKGRKKLTVDKIDIKALKEILKLIEKQQKKIEELKEDNNHQWEERCRLTFDIEKNFISKDKIREKIKELENSIDNFTYRNLTGKDIRGAVIRELKSILKEE